LSLGRLALVLVAVPALLVPAGCQSTQDKAAALRAQGIAQVAAEHGISVTKPTNQVKILDSATLHDQYGDAVAVEVQNTSNEVLVSLPILIDLRDAKGKSIYRNDLPGLDPSLTHISLLKPGETLTWVDDQVQPNGDAKSVQVKVGPPEQNPPRAIPQLDISAPRLHNDPSGVEINGTVQNRSQIDQRHLTLFAVARRGGEIVAAGRGQIKNAKAGASSRFSSFFIGNPQGGELAVAGPPTVLE
jgi:hypothetical protein